jgi:DNA polymerase-3 subunit alpha
MKEFIGQGSIKKIGFRRSTIVKLAAFFESERLREIAESDIFWDRISSIEPVGIQDTYDLTIGDYHNFVADGIIVHNSHSTAYALIAYMTAYLKAHYPVEFMAALLSGDIPGRNFKSKDALVEHLEDCQRMKVEVVPPDVNRSEGDFTVADGKIVFGLSAIKSCGDAAVEAIVAARRRAGPFRDLFDFCERVDPQECGRATIETLIKAGAFDSFAAKRAQLLQILERALQCGAAANDDRRSGQLGLFDDLEDDDAPVNKIELPDVPELDERQRLSMEKEVLGFYLSSHPLAEHEQTLRTFATHTSSQLAELDHRAEVLLGGMLSAIKFTHTKNARPGAPSKYAMWDLEDMSGMVRCIMWPDQFAEQGELVKPDTILGVRGAVDRRPGSEETNLIVSELIPLDELSTRFTAGVVVVVREEVHGDDSLVKLREIVRGYPGRKSLEVRLELADGGSVAIDCPKYRVEIEPELLQRIDDLLGPGHIRKVASPLPKKDVAQRRPRRALAGI